MTAQFWPSHVVMEVRGASKTYLSGANEVKALTDMTLALKSGELTGIVGPSGSGKTTFLMIAGLLEPPTTGTVHFRDQPIANASTRLNNLRDFRRTHVGFIFQKANLIPFLTAVENVQIALEINDVRPKQAKARARELLAQFGLDHRENNYPSQLSGGEQQRVSIARALANDPVLLLADEPTAALDGSRGRQVMEVFRTLADVHRVAVCVVTHDPRWSDIFDRIVEMSDGRVVEVRPGGAMKARLQI
ncbi:ABC transporter ATP-binding protein [Xanthobacter autotrophicus]|uniref:ABC transporter ATP-binding protein n=1 Tax=Xanthobacter TaxID=279 RepID=UPI0024AA7004|nr:ABC transporter ATP-binding protein [Xanthobacter autotrophicus]MDI4663410.1 ABC transporter ATP-binding protein [Xanthobacter autotrophicus]